MFLPLLHISLRIANICCQICNGKLSVISSDILSLTLYRSVANCSPKLFMLHREVSTGYMNDKVRFLYTPNFPRVTFNSRILFRMMYPCRVLCMSLLTHGHITKVFLYATNS